MGSHRRVGAEQTQGLRTKNGVNEMLASHFLLRDFTEGENLVVAFRLRLLDPTGAVSNAIALHRSVERHGSASYSSRQQISTCVPGFCHKHRTIELLGPTVLCISNDALPDHKNDPIPSSIRIVSKCTRY